MTDETPTPQGAAPATPNRSGRRKPPLIEGEPVREIAPTGTASPTTQSADTPTQGPEPAPTPAPEPAPAAASAAATPGTDEPTTAATAPPGENPPSGEPAGEPAPRRRLPIPLPEGLGAMAAVSLASAALAAILVYAVTPSAPGEGGGWPGALEARIDAVERLARDAARRAGEASEAARKVADAPQAGAGASALAPLEGRIAALEKAGRAPPPASEPLEQRLAALEKSLAAPKLDARATETRAPVAPPINLDPLREQVGAAEQRLQALERQLAPIAKDGPDAARKIEALAQAVQGADGRLKAVEERLQPLGARVDEARGQAETERKRAEALAARALDAARLALAQSLVGAVDAGAPFAAQADALTRLGAPAERMAALKDSAATGVALPADLARAFAALEEKVTARQDPGPSASLADRLASSAASLVRVRPAGEPTGDAPADVAARIRRALERGDVAAALQAWNSLSDAGKAVSADWAARARARLAAQEAARAILAEASERLSRT